MATTRQLAAIMFTDMVGYTALMQTNEALAIRKRERHRAVLEAAIPKYRGRLLQYYGDGTLSIFNSTIDGVRCALEIQQSLTGEPRVDLRIGLHTGDILLQEEGIYGDGVNIASRIESLAVPGSIFISEKVYDDIKNQSDIETREMGSFELKNVRLPVRIFALANPGLAVPQRHELKGKLEQPTNRLAVLPFENFSADPENEYFSDGITEELINAFTRVEGLLVTSRTSSFAFKKRPEDVREIGSKLNVDKILEGSVRKAGNRVRITAQLISSADGVHLWSETFDRDLTDIFAVQDDIARIITNRLRESLAAPAAGEHLVRPTTRNPEAYSIYLKGVYLRNKLVPGEVRRAIGYFEDALRLDPQFAPAAAQVAGCYVQLGGQGQMTPQKAFEQALRYADTALRLDDTLPEAYSAKGAALMMKDWKWKEAYDHLSRALELNPGSTMASYIMAVYYQIHGQVDAAIAALEKAVLYDPLSPILNAALAQEYFFARRYQEAMNLAEKILELDPHMRNALEIKGYCLGMLGDWEGAIPLFQTFHQLAGHPLRGLTPLGYAYAKTGQAEKVQACLAKLEQRLMDEPESVTEVDLGTVYWALGEKDKAFHYFTEALNRGMAITYGFYSPLLDDIFQDPRVEEMKHRMNL